MRRPTSALRSPTYGGCETGVDVSFAITWLPTLARHTRTSTSTNQHATMPSRPGQLSLATVLATQNPTIDLHLSAYEASARNFSQAFADFNTRAIAEITQRREAHAAETKKLAERAQNAEKETNQCKLKEIELIGGQYRDVACAVYLAECRPGL